MDTKEYYLGIEIRWAGNDSHSICIVDVKYSERHKLRSSECLLENENEKLELLRDFLDFMRGFEKG